MCSFHPGDQEEDQFVSQALPHATVPALYLKKVREQCVLLLDGCVHLHTQQIRD